MSARWLSVFLLFSVACYAGQQSACETGSGPTPVPVASASPSPSPSPSPSASPTPSPKETCDFDVLRLQPVAGLTVAIGQNDAHLSLTPYQTIICKANDIRVECAGKAEGSPVLHEVAESCNLQVKRLETLKWLNSAPDAVTVGLGYEPSVTRKKAGEAIIQATLEGLPSNAVVVR